MGLFFFFPRAYNAPSAYSAELSGWCGDHIGIDAHLFHPPFYTLGRGRRGAALGGNVEALICWPPIKDTVSNQSSDLQCTMINRR